MLGIILVVSRSLTVMSKYNQLLSGAKVTPCTKQQQPRNCLIVSELNPDPVTG